MKKIAFFDFDGTITDNDTFIEFAKFSVGKSAFYKAFFQSIPILCLWKLGLKSNSEAKQKLFSRLYRGMDYTKFQELCTKFRSLIDLQTRAEIIDAIMQHKRSGDQVVIVSASIGDWIRPWAAVNAIDNVIATEAEIDLSNRLTGRFATKNCHGKEKAIRIQHQFPKIADYETWGYGDSSGDNEMLSLVNHPKRV